MQTKKNVIKLGATNPTRDFNFVEDTCRSYIAVANSSKTLGEVVNSASNFEISIGETALLISKIMNSEIDIVQANERVRPEKSEVNRLFGCNDKLLRLTGWKPKFSGLDGFKKGLSLTIDWFKDPTNLSYYSENYEI